MIDILGAILPSFSKRVYWWWWRWCDGACWHCPLSEQCHRQRWHLLLMGNAGINPFQIITVWWWWKNIWWPLRSIIRVVSIMISVLLESLCIKNHSLSLHYSFAKIDIERELEYWWWWFWWLCWLCEFYGVIVAVIMNRDLILCILSILCLELTLYCRGHRRQGTLGCRGSEQEYCGIDLKRRTSVIEHWEPLKKRNIWSHFYGFPCLFVVVRVIEEHEYSENGQSWEP